MRVGRGLRAPRPRPLAVVNVLLVLLLLAAVALVPWRPVPAPRPDPRRLCVADAVQAKAVAGLANFSDWLRRNHATGFIGEIGWPSTRDSAQWNAVGEAWYTAADLIDLPVTAWAAGAWP